MPAGWAAAAGAAASIGGAYLSSQSNKSAASMSADAQRYAADRAAEAAVFRPVGVTTGFGSSTFTQGQYGPESASYTLTPEMQAIRDRLIAEAGTEDTARMRQAAQPLYGGAERLFGLGSQYLATSPEQAKADYMQTQLAALAPSREQNLANLRNQVFQTGRAGLATGGTSTGMMATNPELAAYYNSIANQDLQLAAGAEAAAQQRQQFGAGLFGTGGNLLGQVTPLTVAGYAPLQTQLGLAGSVESLGQQALDIGAQLGGRSATAGANVAQSLLTGGVSAARTQQAADAYNPFGAALTGIGSNPQLANWMQQKLSQPNYDSWQTSGSSDLFGSNSYQSSGGYAGMNAELGLE